MTVSVSKTAFDQAVILLILALGDEAHIVGVQIGELFLDGVRSGIVDEIHDIFGTAGFQVIHVFLRDLVGTPV